MSVAACLLFSVCLTSFLGSFMGSSLNVAVPFIAEQFGVAPEDVTWVINSYTITVAAFLIPASALANRFSYRRTYRAGCLLSAITSILVTLAPTYELLVAARSLQGFSFALIFCTAIAMLTDQTAKERRTYVIGYSTAAVYVGTSLSPFLSGFIVEHIGWQMMFIITAIGELTAFFTVAKVPCDRPNAKDLKMPKQAVCFLTGVLILVSFSSISLHHFAYYTLAAGLILALIFLILEYRSDQPIFPTRLLVTNRILSCALLASLCNYASTFTLALLLSLHLQLVLGIRASVTGVILVVQPVIMVIMSTQAGRMSRHLSTNALTTIGMSSTAAAFILLHFIDAQTPLGYIILAQILAGFGFGTFSAPNTSVVMSSVDRSRFSTVSAVQAVTRNMGMACAMAILTIVLYDNIDAAPGSSLYVRELSHSISETFGVSALNCLMGVIYTVMGFIGLKRSQTPRH